ncbi:CobW family GTP-binding protein [Acidihalobacter ferrooxydans]|uniref:CobW C-terminal domain-containing protein n=1 Tax=Acidihalobacter ferrooxydans TaxID=1765967 RepID=A0A1P8UIW0_9GAMM|nr:GTP-binding protein [Acidihalobacter ferrooxydans]APZ43762.1 hypothetical protein BW247_12255 [Acidihalobacter ferrooxydans]
MPDEIAFDVVPVNVVTGFLGSGKTTLLKRLLASEAFGDTAVLVNEFGDVGLDHQLLQGVAADAVLLPSGCLCCSIRGELATALRELYSRRQRGEIPAFRRVVLETTGLADPGPIVSTLLADQVIKHHFRLGAITTTVDACNAMMAHLQQPEWIRQVAAADRLIITKTDIAEPAQLHWLDDYLAQVNPAAEVVRADVLETAADYVLDQGIFQNGGVDEIRRWTRAIWMPRAEGRAHESPRTLTGRLPADAHLRSVESFSLVLDRAIDWSAFAVWLSMLLHCHGNAVLRVKGILNVTGSETPVVLHGVQHMIHPPNHLERWPDDDRRTRIVFITRGIDKALIERSLEIFLGDLTA